MARIVIMRHGQSVLNASLEQLVGSDNHDSPFSTRDVHLTEMGTTQARLTGNYLKDRYKFTACYCSPFVRAEETASYVLGQCQLSIDISIDGRLSEKKFGDLYGFTAEDVKNHYPDEYEERKQLGRYWYRPPNGENYDDVRTRVSSFINDLNKVNQDCKGDILVVTHQIPYKMFYAELHNLDDKEVEKLAPVPNCSIQMVESNGSGLISIGYVGVRYKNG